MQRPQLDRLPTRMRAVAAGQLVKRRVELAVKIGCDQQLRGVSADGLLAIPAERCLGGLIPVDDQALGVKQGERTQGVVQQRPQSWPQNRPTL
jgi:hypothetical protein